MADDDWKMADAPAPQPGSQPEWRPSEEPAYHPRPPSYVEQAYDESFSWSKFFTYGCGCLLLFVAVMTVLSLLGLSLTIHFGG